MISADHLYSASAVMKKKSLVAVSSDTEEAVETNKVVVVQFCQNGRHGIKTKHESSLHSSHEVIEMGPLIDFPSKNGFFFLCTLGKYLVDPQILLYGLVNPKINIIVGLKQGVIYVFDRS